MTSLLTCPQCQSLQHAADVEFCFRCRFPLMLIAGKYRIEKLLAEGGQGAVYLARHTELDLDPLRVIKIVKSQLFEQIPNLAARFHREVQVTSALSQRCQHIVRIYDDFGGIPSLGRFYVMEHLEGRRLSDLLDDPMRLPDLKVCLHIFHQLCDAMRFAHREDIIHRDLKPDNLMLIPFEDEPLYLKVLDFGIALPTGEQEAAAPKLTQGIIGTPEYMAPEQLTGQEVDARTDLYAMGVILYEMLTGKMPHEVQGTGQEAFFELVMKRLKDEPAPPSVVRPDLEFHPAIEEVVMTLLRRAPNERYPNVEVLKSALRDAAREIRRDSKTVLQDTKPEFDDETYDEFGGVALRFELQAAQEDPDSESTDFVLPDKRPQTLGFGEANASQDTPHEAPLVEALSAMALADEQALVEPDPMDFAFDTVTPGQPPPSVHLSDSFEEEKVVETRVAVAPEPMLSSESGWSQDDEDIEEDDDEETRIAAPPVPVLAVVGGQTIPQVSGAPIPVELVRLPLLSEDEFDDKTAIDQGSEAQQWLQVSLGKPPVDAAPTRESPAFFDSLKEDTRGRRWRVWLSLSLLGLVLASLGLYWFIGRRPSEGLPVRRTPLVQPTKSVQDRASKGSLADGGEPVQTSIRRVPPRRARRAPLHRVRASVIHPVMGRAPQPRRRRRKQRRGLKRSLVGQAKRPLVRKKSVTGCPVSTSIHWFHIKIFPAHAKLTLESGAVREGKEPGKNQRCIGIRSGVASYLLRASGYDACQIRLSRRSHRRVLLRLKPRKSDGLDLQWGSSEYCKGRW